MERPLRYVGTQPWARTREGHIALLVARESDTQEWCSFGGGPEASDASTVAGAARETFEESYGVLGTPDVVEEAVRARGRLQTYGGDRDSRGKPWRSENFVYEIAYMTSLPDIARGVYEAFLLSGRSQKWKKGFGEKDAFAWVTVAAGSSGPDAVGAMQSQLGGGRLRKVYADVVGATLRLIEHEL